MSDIPADYQERLNLKEQLARIDKALVENQKLQAENQKLQAETKKYNREPWLLIAAAMMAFLAGLAARLPELIQALR